MSHLTRLLSTFLLLVVVALYATACGDGDARTTSTAKKSGGGTSQPAPGIRGNDAGPDAGQAEATLRITMKEVGGRNAGATPVPASLSCSKRIPATCSGTVTCPATASDTDGVALCTWIAAEGAALLTAEAPDREICTQIYGGPTTATVSGTIDGKQVKRSFSRTNGCEIARFDEAARFWNQTETDVPQPEVISDPPSAFEQ